MKKISLLLLIFCFLYVILIPEVLAYNVEKICQSIYIIEGKEKARQYFGIETIECKTFDKCKVICENTVRNNIKRFKNQSKEKDFLVFLGKRYCPPNWKVWVKNLKFYLNKGE
ncbi:MAG: hypothetical protein B6I28_01255 [Fusobacteriia bacterium 4572_132]|nr:MAG: hypothetical protein B6I28_01255 [Fusobacteriia bacterium 4572_132]